MKGRIAILVGLLLVPLISVIWLMSLAPGKPSDTTILAPGLNTQAIPAHQIWIVLIVGGLFLTMIVLALGVWWWRRMTHHHHYGPTYPYRGRYNRY